jgi:diguanylate cyclase (GGDEF)-like protein
VARYGGEEFTIILVDTSQTHSLAVTQRIVNNIEKFKFSLDGINEKMTISAGMAEFPKDSDNIKVLIEKADKAMYKAKKLGGNNVVVCA